MSKKLKKSVVAMLSVLSVGCFMTGIASFNVQSAKADAQTKFLLDTKALSYTDYLGNPANGKLWWADGVNNDCYAVPQDGYFNPGSTHDVALCVTVPFDMTLGLDLGTYRGGDYFAQSDGILLAVFLNDEKIYPANSAEYAEVSATATTITLSQNYELKANDKLRYVVNCGENNNSSFDSVNIEAAFSYEVGGEQKTFTAKNNAWTTGDGRGSEASQFGSAYQKQSVVQYEYATILQGTEKANEATDGVKVLLSEKPLNVCTIGSDKMWMVSADTLNTYCSYYNGYNYIVPSANSMTAIVFTAPCDGTISNAFGCGSVTAENADGDGMRMNVVLNDTVIYPKQGLWATPSYGTDLEISYNNQTIKKGDKLYYIAENGGNGDCSWDNLKSKIRFMWTDSATNKSCLIDFAENYYVLEEDGNKSVTFGDYDYKRKDVFSFVEISSLVSGQTYPEQTTDDTQVLLSEKPLSLVNLEGTDMWMSSVDIRNTYCSYYGGYNYLVPGSTSMVGIEFVVPTDGKILNSFGCGSIFQEYEEGDGVRISVVLNNTVIYPSTGVWEEVPCGQNNALEILFNEQTVQVGDRLIYVVDNGGNGDIDWDSAACSFKFGWTDNMGKSTLVDLTGNYYTNNGNENVNFGDYKKSDIIKYKEITALKASETMEKIQTDGQKINLNTKPLEYVDLNGGMLWGGLVDDAYTYVFPEEVNPGVNYMVAVAFTAPCDGKISNKYGLGTVSRAGYVPEDLEVDESRICVAVDKGGCQEVVFPAQGVWQSISMNSAEKTELAFNDIELTAGQTIYYIVDNGGKGNSAYDAVRFNVGFTWIDENNPNGTWIQFSDNYYTESEKEMNVTFGDYKRGEVFSYLGLFMTERVVVGEAKELSTKTINELAQEEMVRIDNSYRFTGDTSLILNETWGQPGNVYSLGLEWKAPEDGRVDLSRTQFKISDWCAYYLDTPTEVGIYSNGIRFRIVLNKTQLVYPTVGEWEILASGGMYTLTGVKVFDVKAGDTITLVLDANEELNFDCLEISYNINFAKDGEEYTDTYNNVFDFNDEEKLQQWKFVGIEIELDGNRKFESGVTNLPELPYVENAENSGGCSGSVKGIQWIIPLLVGTALLVKAGKRRNKEENAQ